MTKLTKLVNGVETPLTDEDHTLLEQIEAQKEGSCWDFIRAERNGLLAACDWTQLPDASADAAAWATYRQALRDITTQTDPFDIVWPASPSAGE
jgi:hypothetical protein